MLALSAHQMVVFPMRCTAAKFAHFATMVHHVECADCFQTKIAVKLLHSTFCSYHPSSWLMRHSRRTMHRQRTPVCISRAVHTCPLYTCIMASLQPMLYVCASTHAMLAVQPPTISECTWHVCDHVSHSGKVEAVCYCP